MLYQVESMFDDMEKKMRRLKKQKYEENMENFMAANEAYFWRWKLIWIKVTRKKQQKRLQRCLWKL